MRVKLDENIPRRVETLLRSRGHDVDTVHDEGLVGHPDPAVARAAAQSARVFVTLDRGFPAAAGLHSGHPGVVVIKLRDQSAPQVERLVAYLLNRGDLEDIENCVVIVTPDRIRIRRPG